MARVEMLREGLKDAQITLIVYQIQIMIFFSLPLTKLICSPFVTK